MTIPIDGQLVRRNDADFPITEDTDNKGGWRVVPTVSAMDGIHPVFRKEGMRVKVLETGREYDLQADLTTWTLVPTGGGQPSTGALSFSNVAAMRAATAPDDGTLATLLGYYSAGDGGGGDFFWSAGNVSAEDGGTVFKITGVATGRWVRLYDSRRVSVLWFGAVGDNASHPLSNYFASIGAAKAVYAYAKSLTDEVDLIAAEACVELLRSTPVSPACRGGEVYFPGRIYLWNRYLRADRTLGIRLTGPASGVQDGLRVAGGALVLFTGATRYKNESNVAPVISCKSAQYVQIENLNIETVDLTYHGHVIDFSHAGGNTIPRQLGLPTLVFHTDGTITRSGGPAGNDFLTDGWEIGDLVFVRLSASNNAITGTVTAVAAGTLTTDGAWVSETTSTAWLYSQTPDSSSPMMRNVGISAILQDPGVGIKACVSLSAALFGHIQDCHFGTAERGVLFSDNSAGFVYSNSHLIEGTTFNYQKYCLSSGRQTCSIKSCSFEGLGGTMEAAYVDEHQRTTSQLDCQFTFASGPKTITRSTGSFLTDGFQVGDSPFYSKRDGTLGAPALGTITVLTATVMTVNGSVPDIAGAASYGIEIWDDQASGDRFPASTAVTGNTLTVVQGVGGTFQRSDGGSFLTDGWFIGEEVHGPGGGVQGIVTAVSDSTLTCDNLTAPAGAHDADNYYIWNGAGASPLTISDCWFGDQYRMDSWIKLLGSDALNLSGNFINGNARALENYDKYVSGVIQGNSVSMTRNFSTFYFGGLVGALGLRLCGNNVGTVVHKTFYPAISLVMDGNRSLIDGDTFDKVDTSYRKYSMRLKEAITFTKYMNTSGPVPAPPTNATVAVKGGDVEVLDTASGLVLLDRSNGNRYRLKVTAGVLGVEVVP